MVEAVTKNDENEPILPMKIEDFEIGECLGRGEYAQVYLAKHLKTNFLVSLKIVKKSILKEKFEKNL